MRVLITGAAGGIGRHLSKSLETQYDLRLLDLHPLDTDPRWVQVDLTRPAEVHAAMRGVDAVVHLAMASGHEGQVEDDEFSQTRFDVNVRGTWNVLNAAQRAGVKRVVHTSSLMVVWGYPSPEWVDSDAEPRPVGTYAQTKLLAEVLCEQAVREHNMSIVCLRIPKPVDVTDPRWRQRKVRPQWIAIPELMRAYRCALTAPDIAFEIVTIVGESSQRRWDLSKAERVLGYQPETDFQKLGLVVGSEDEPLPEWETL